MELVISIAVAIGIYELYAWLPNIIDWIVERALLHLPIVDRERYREEWKADLAAMPATLARIINAIGYHFAARRIAFNEEVDNVIARVTELRVTADSLARKAGTALGTLTRTIDSQSLTLHKVETAIEEVDQICLTEEKSLAFSLGSPEIPTIRSRIINVKKANSNNIILLLDIVEHISIYRKISLLHRRRIRKAVAVIEKNRLHISKFSRMKTTEQSEAGTKGDWNDIAAMMNSLWQKVERKLSETDGTRRRPN